MGIQIGFSRKDVEHLIVERDEEELHCGCCYSCLEGLGEEKCEDIYVAQYVRLEWNAATVWVHVHNDQCWVDANHWGQNRNKILFILEGNNIEYTEG